jgi:hypothetical protein
MNRYGLNIDQRVIPDRRLHLGNRTLSRGCSRQEDSIYIRIKKHRRSGPVSSINETHRYEFRQLTNPGPCVRRDQAAAPCPPYTDISRLYRSQIGLVGLSTLRPYAYSVPYMSYDHVSIFMSRSPWNRSGRVGFEELVAYEGREDVSEHNSPCANRRPSLSLDWPRRSD